MKFNCSKENIAEAVNNVSPAVSSKSALTALEGILLSCKDGSLSLTGYNLELGITKVIDVASREDGLSLIHIFPRIPRRIFPRRAVLPRQACGGSVR